MHAAWLAAVPAVGAVVFCAWLGTSGPPAYAPMAGAVLGLATAIALLARAATGPRRGAPWLEAGLAVATGAAWTGLAAGPSAPWAAAFAERLGLVIVACLASGLMRWAPPSRSPLAPGEAGEVQAGALAAGGLGLGLVLFIILLEAPPLSTAWAWAVCLPAALATGRYRSAARSRVAGPPTRRGSRARDVVRKLGLAILLVYGFLLGVSSLFGGVLGAAFGILWGLFIVPPALAIIGLAYIVRAEALVRPRRRTAKAP